MCSRLPCSTRFPYTTLFRSHGGGIDGAPRAPGGAPGDLGEGHGRGALAEGVEVLLGEPRVCGEDDLGPGVTHTLEVDAVGLVEEHRDLTAQLLELRLDPGKQPVVIVITESRGSHALRDRSEEHTSELQSRGHLVCRLLLE